MLRPTHLIHVLAFILLLECTKATPLILTNHNLTASNRIVTCTDLLSWVPSRVIPLPQDCYEALDFMRQMEGNKRANQRFEFLASDARQTTRLLPLRTPRVYSIRKCTIAVTMLSSYRPWDLPPETRRGPYPTNEIATLAELMVAAKAVMTSCVKEKGHGGWSAAGWLGLGIAVTVWESGSQIDRLVKAQIPRQPEDPGMNGVSDA